MCLDFSWRNRQGEGVSVNPKPRRRNAKQKQKLLKETFRVRINDSRPGGGNTILILIEFLKYWTNLIVLKIGLCIFIKKIIIRTVQFIESKHTVNDLSISRY